MLTSLLLAFAPAVPQDVATDGPLAQRAKEIAALVAPEPKWDDGLFDPAFVKAVPPDKIRALCAGLFEKYGAIESMRLVESRTALSGKYDATLAKGDVMPVTIGLTPNAPHAVVELWFGAPVPGFADFAAVITALKKLPGNVSFGVYRLNDDAVEPIAEHDAERALAIGSAFKLYVLGALAADVHSGKRKLTDTVPLQARYRSLPSGKLQRWPLGSPLTLSTLAALMISESDNTATDHLLFTVGRTHVEALLEPMGNTSVARNTPFLATSELFRLKLAAGGAKALEYEKLETDARRAYLEGTVAALSIDPDALDMTLFAKPAHIETIEWFASARDLARAMHWLRKSTASGAAAPLRDVLAINPGLDVSKERFPFVGFKGGSEPGVLNLTYLLRAQDESWYALSCGWNDPANTVDEATLLGITTRAIALIGKPAEAPAKAR